MQVKFGAVNRFLFEERGKSRRMAEEKPIGHHGVMGSIMDKSCTFEAERSGKTTPTNTETFP